MAISRGVALTALFIVLAWSRDAMQVEAAHGQSVVGASAESSTNDGPPASCPVTQVPEDPFVPPKPYPAVPGEGQFWFGSENLWTRLAVDGVWHGLNTKSGYGNKLFWYSVNFDEKKDSKRRVIVTGRRRDAGAPPFVTYADCCSSTGRRPDYSFMIAGVDIPTSGCWEIEGKDRDQRLSFVVWVAP